MTGRQIDSGEAVPVPEQVTRAFSLVIAYIATSVAMATVACYEASKMYKVTSGNTRA